MFFLYYLFYMCYHVYGDAMKNRGFTLIELLAVIVIIGVIALITVPNIMNVINSSKDELNKEQKRAIENSARIWGTKYLYIDNSQIYSNKTGNIIKSITLQELIEDGQLDNREYKNLKIDNFDEYGVCVEYENNQFIYTYSNINECS